MKNIPNKNQKHGKLKCLYKQGRKKNQVFQAWVWIIVYIYIYLYKKNKKKQLYRVYLKATLQYVISIGI